MFLYMKFDIVALRKNFSIQEIKFCIAELMLNAVDFIGFNFYLI